MKINIYSHDLLALLQQSGQLTYLEAEQLSIYYHFASILDELIHEIDARNLSRTRDVLPMAQGTELIRDLLRMTCWAAGAENHSTCPIWRHGLPFTWETSCGACRIPAASRALTCAMLFPASNEKENLKRRVPKSPSEVSNEHLKKWTSGSRPFPINRASQAIKSLHWYGLLSDHHHYHNSLMMEANAGFTKNLRGIRQMLKMEWPKMIEEDRTFVAGWNGFDHWYVSHRNEMTCEGNAIADLEAYPQADGHDIYEALTGQPSFDPVKLQSVPALTEIRVTPFPLPIDPVEFHAYPQGMLALRLFIRPAFPA